MRSLGLGLALAAGLAFGVAAQEGRQAAITDVIQSQIDAFLADDFETAFTYASPTIRRMFGSPGRFGVMVRQGYPMVWRPSEVKFLGLKTKNGRLVQRVLLTDERGALHLAEYEMVQTADGWQINGVAILDGLGFGA